MLEHDLNQRARSCNKMSKCDDGIFFFHFFFLNIRENWWWGHDVYIWHIRTPITVGSRRFSVSQGDFFLNIIREHNLYSVMRSNGLRSGVKLTDNNFCTFPEKEKKEKERGRKKSQKKTERWCQIVTRNWQLLFVSSVYFFTFFFCYYTTVCRLFILFILFIVLPDIYCYVVSSKNKG